jgi:hypothetical protein
MNFERHQNPLKSIGIGRRQKRLFKDIEEVAQWATLFPEEYTDGFVDSWFGTNEDGNHYFDFRSGRFNGDVLSPSDPYRIPVSHGKLQMVKWAKDNIHLEDWPEERIGLKECKQIFDRVEEIIFKEYQEKIENYKIHILEELKQKYQTNEN